MPQQNSLRRLPIDEALSQPLLLFLSLVVRQHHAEVTVTGTVTVTVRVTVTVTVT